MRVGVLALQGGFARHALALASVGAEPVEIRQRTHLGGIDALVLPGGESTTMSMLLERLELFEPLADLLAGGMPAFGTCAGMILLATVVADGRPDQRSFAAIDIEVRRNGYGRQVDSFEAELTVTGIDGGPLPAVFIRAPIVERVGPDVEVMATVDHAAVLCRQGSVVAASFHPELGDDLRLHRWFVESVVAGSARHTARFATGG